MVKVIDSIHVVKANTDRLLALPCVVAVADHGDGLVVSSPRTSPTAPLGPMQEITSYSSPTEYGSASESKLTPDSSRTPTTYVLYDKTSYYAAAD